MVRKTLYIIKIEVNGQFFTFSKLAYSRREAMQMIYVDVQKMYKLINYYS